MAQWLYQYSGMTHSTKVEDRREILDAAIATWNAALADERTAALHKKLLRLAGDLQVAIIKEQTAFLSRELDSRSPAYLAKANKIATLRAMSLEEILQAHGWRVN